MNRRTILRLIAGAGALIAMPVLAAKSKYLFRVNQAKCVGCKDCERVCPVAAISFIRGKAVIDMETCNGCALCPAVCSYGAINQCDIQDENL